jgi:hypothetical protein
MTLPFVIDSVYHKNLKEIDFSLLDNKWIQCIYHMSYIKFDEPNNHRFYYSSSTNSFPTEPLRYYLDKQVRQLLPFIDYPKSTHTIAQAEEEFINTHGHKLNTWNQVRFQKKHNVVQISLDYNTDKYVTVDRDIYLSKHLYVVPILLKDNRPVFASRLDYIQDHRARNSLRLKILTRIDLSSIEGRIWTAKDCEELNPNDDCLSFRKMNYLLQSHEHHRFYIALASGIVGLKYNELFSHEIIYKDKNPCNCTISNIVKREFGLTEARPENVGTVRVESAKNRYVLTTRVAKRFHVCNTEGKENETQSKVIDWMRENNATQNTTVCWID